MSASPIFCRVAAALLGLVVCLRAADDLRITEFMAANDGPLVDEDGDRSDWIEIHNAGPNAVNLLGWALTDRPSDLRRWRFPSTNLAPNGYLMVFASGKDRRVPGAPLHTSFQIRREGEYLALVGPDGTNVASAYGPFPPQVNGVSYGIPVQPMLTTLVASGATARVRVPVDGSLGTAWTTTMFEDTSWASMRTGVGFETDGVGPFVPVPLADSVAEFSGVQGQGNWQYGYWDRKRDTDGVYAPAEFVPFPNATGEGHGPNNFWTGALWDWFAGDPPHTQLSGDGGRPAGQNGVSGRDAHWAVRRYISETDGAITITGRVVHTSDWVYVTATGVASDSGMHIFLNGRGEGWIDDIKLVAGTVPETGANLLPNGDFESGALSPWTASSILSGSSVTTAVKHSGTRSLRIVSTGAGSQNASIKQTISPSLANGQTYTLSYWYLPATNSASLVVQTRNRWLDTTPAYCGDGIVARVFIDGASVYQQSAFVSGTNYAVTVPVQAGSTVDFAIDPDGASDDRCDGAIFTAAIRTAPPPPVVVADSVADWSANGAQGGKNWFYGYYDQTADTVTPNYQMGDFVPFPRGQGPFGPGNFWDGEKWDWWNTNPNDLPNDEIGERLMRPNGSNSGPRHWVIRRWRSEVSGTIIVDWSLIKLAVEGDGVTGRILHNGAPKDSTTLPGDTAIVINRSVVITNVQVGDAIDLALDPLGTSSNTTDEGDRSLVSAVIRGTPNLASQVASSLEATMRNANATACLRIPFTIPDPAAIQYLTLRMKHDDGFMAWLNGQLVASANAPLVPAWNSAATATRTDAAAVEFQEFDLTSLRGLLQPGNNVLAIQGLNASASDGDFLILPELIAARVTLDPTAQRYFVVPTPGAPNGYGTTNLGPLILRATHWPNVPRDHEDLVVTAHLQPTFNAIGSVRLIHRVMFGAEASTTMFDDGQHGDGAAGDHVFGATIPAGASQPGEMVRYYVLAADTLMNSTRFPSYADPQDSPEYQGTVVFNPGLSNPLPVLHMFAQNPALLVDLAGTRASLFYDDEFYDNVRVNQHGQTTPSVFAKISMNVDMNSGHQFRWSRQGRRVHDFNLLTTAPDKAFLRHVLAYETFAAAGVPSHFAFNVRVDQNNAFWGVMHLVENGDDEFLERLGLDPEGALYKLYLPLTNAYGGVAEKKTRKNENNADLQALIDGCRLTGAPLRSFLFDNVDLPEVVNFLAVMQVVQNEDCCDYKNYYLYRDTRGTREWQMLPWDLDLTFGRVFTDWFYANGRWQGGYLDTNIYWMNLYYTQRRSTLDFIGKGNTLVDAMWSIPEIFDMFIRRWTTVQEELLQPTNTHPLRLKFERRVDELAALSAPDAALDLVRWGTFVPAQTLPQAAAILKTQYFAPRRPWVFDTLRFGNGGPYLGPQPSNAVIRFTHVEFNPASGNQSQEYIQISNPNAFAMDVSGWRITGAINYTLRPGVVIPGFSALYVSPDVNAFRARTTGPRGGQGLLVQGNYQGQLSARGESLQLLSATGRTVATTNYTGAPSLAQQYLRVTEIMYHPAPSPPGLSTNADEFEFIEVRNTGPVTISLTGVRFANGITFDFTGSAVTTLAPGASTVVARNVAAFLSRYGAGVSVAGQYTGSLDNMGENIRLEDAAGEKILDFNYDNDWYPITDGVGFSLVIGNAAAPWDTWSLPSNWRPGGRVGGTPAETDGAPSLPATILITEVLTHSTPPALDRIEIHNPTLSPVNVNGWYLSDDFPTPAKHRIQGRPSLPPGGYLVFDEDDFNAPPEAPQSFSLSSLGDEVFLFSADTNGALSGYFHGFSFGAAEVGVTFGRHTNSVGQEHFVAQNSATFGAANSGPRVGPIVISEVFYRPPDDAEGDNASDEFIELQNISTDIVPLFNPSSPADTWRLAGTVEFEFPLNASMDAGRFLLLVNFDASDLAALAAFRIRHAVPESVRVLGPYRGKLDNSRGSVRLLKPDFRREGEVPYVLVETVDYSDTAPWLALADGLGPSLHRIPGSHYGNDPIHWTAGVPSPGRAALGGSVPTIVMQPASQTAMASGSPTFNVSVVGSGPLRYQWRFLGTNLPGATNATLTVSNALTEHAGPYQVVVFNGAGATLSSNAMLTILYGVYFTRQPTNTSVAPGATATFSASAISSTPVRYQWRRNGVDLPGATNSTLTVPNVQPAVSGWYQVVATDGIGSLPGTPALLSVLGPPVITTQPQSLAVTAGEAASFNVTATGTLPLNYQWRLHGTNLPGQNSPSLILPVAQSANAGSYTVFVSNSVGATSSAVATLTILLPPFITVHPQDRVVTNGGHAQFSAEAVGSSPLGFQWRRNGVPLLNETNATLSVSNAFPSHAGNYTVVVSNSVGVAISQMATLVVLVAPVITLEPSNLTVTNGLTATFLISAAGSAPLSFQWHWMGGFLPGATNAALTIPNVQAAHAGDYQVIVGNGVGTVTSMVATLTVRLRPSILEPPPSLTVTNGAAVSLNVVATGDPPLGYQWRLNGANLFGATAPALNIATAQPNHAGQYTVVVNNSYGSATSAVATLVVLVPPRIVTPPISRSARLGSNVTFNVLANGTAPLALQWRFGSTESNDAPIPGATASSLGITNIQPSHAGAYRVTVSNMVGSVTSAVATLTLLDGDTDGDGLPDLWEIGHRFDPFLNDAHGDADLDGMTQLQEFISGTDPRDPSSYLKIDRLAALPGARWLHFLAISNKTYTVEFRGSANGGSWRKLADVPARSTNRVEVVPDLEVEIETRFYRLVTPAQ